jgi:5,10-methylenetetrahydromethanopterin reductase
LQDARLRYNAGSGIPIYVACSGPKMLELAGELADGVIMLCGAVPETIEFALSHVRRGAALAERSVDDMDVAWGAATVIEDERQSALDQARLMAAWYANHAVQYATAVGADQRVIGAMRSKEAGTNLHEARDAAAMASDDMVDRLALAGDAAHVRGRIGAARELGVQHFELFLIGPRKEHTLRRFAAEVMPAFR